MQELKKALRSELIRRRREMDKAYRKNLDERIYNILKGIDGILNFDAYLIYASSAIEVVAAPRILEMVLFLVPMTTW